MLARSAIVHPARRSIVPAAIETPQAPASVSTVGNDRGFETAGSRSMS
jgi:hypothetical protein